MMKKLLLLLCYLLYLCEAGEAIDLASLEPIKPIASFSVTSAAVIFTCQDGSQVQVSILAPDLVRVRAAYRQALPARDHSWAIAKPSWDAPPWHIREETDRFLISTSELEVSVGRAPLLVEFRDAKTHQVINSDFQPMMFDPKSGAVYAAKKLGFDEHFYGLGEKAWRLDKRRGKFTMWNSDTPAYIEGTDPIYQSIPFYLGWQCGAAYGIFFDNSYRTYFDLGQTSQEYVSFAADSGEMNYYFFWGPSFNKILGRYAELTGHMPLPPMWALGHQQSRYSYYPDLVAEEVVNTYREKDLPLDVLYLDIHYMNGYRVFTWDPQRFPDPTGFTSRLKRQGVKVVTIVDPGVKYQPSEQTAGDTRNPELGPQTKDYYVYDEGLKNNYYLKHKDGRTYIGKVWPGESVFVDYTLEGARRWWGDLHRAYTDHGVAGIWNDMNEPADFTDVDGKLKMDVVSYDEGEYSTQAKNRNVFALLEARATYEGLARLEPDKRPYVITRAGYAGIQRYSTMWTGDNTSTWESLALSIPMFQSLGLSGEPFVGADMGGFIGRSNGELLTRWYQVGFLTPFCRNHKAIEGYDQEPWRFGTYYEDIIRKYLKLRYRLLPFLYSTLEEAHRTGVPLFRPLLLNYQQDANTLNVDDQFMVGSDLLVAPILGPGQTGRLVYLPKGDWIDYWSGRRYSGAAMIHVEAPLEVVPLFVRAGAIIPMWPEMNYVGEKPADPVTFDIYPAENEPATTTLYEDDGTSPAYQQGVFRRTTVSAARTGNNFEINWSAPVGSYKPAPRSFVFVVRLPLSADKVSVDGKPLRMVRKMDKESGWYRDGGGIAIRITDDSRAHQIQIRE